MVAAIGVVVCDSIPTQQKKTNSGTNPFLDFEELGKRFLVCFPAAFLPISIKNHTPVTLGCCLLMPYRIEGAMNISGKEEKKKRKNESILPPPPHFLF